MRFVLVSALAIGACSPTQAPKARTAGKWMAISGVGGLIGTSFAARYTADSTHAIVIGFSLLSAVGIGTFAAGDLSTPPPAEETVSERHHRWARILTERAYGYARDGRCPRVRHIEPRVRTYDRELHDFVFMRDPEIQKCLQVPVEAPPTIEVSDPQPAESRPDSP